MMYAPENVPVREETTMQENRRTPDRGEHGAGDGSHHDEECSSTNSPGTANSFSPSREIRPSVEGCAGTVPLYLIPRAVADLIRLHKRTVREIHIRRTRNHFYTIDLKRGHP